MLRQDTRRKVTIVLDINRYGLACDGRGPVDYERTWAEQRVIHQQVVDREHPGTVLLLEHDSVYTAGKRTDPLHMPLDDTPVITVDRGGSITWHGPGQLVAYPILRLPQRVYVGDLVRRLERCVMAVCEHFGVATVPVTGRSGVWVPADEHGPERKICAIGLRVAQGVSMHGIALNCDCDLAAFTRITPCGISDAGVTSLSRECGRDVSVAEAAEVLTEQLRAFFGEWVTTDATTDSTINVTTDAATPPSLPQHTVTAYSEAP